MKKLIISLSALAALLLAGSCQRENLEPVQQGGTVTYTVQVPGALATKADGDGFIAHYEVYRQGEVNNGEALPIYEGSEPFANGSASIELEFVKDQNFVVLFWAQKEGVKVYDIDDLRKVSISKAQKLTSNNFDAEVFAGNDTVINCQSQKNGEVSLVRPVAQINIATTKAGLILAPAGPVLPEKHVEVYKSDVKVYGLWSSFNVATNNVNGETTAGDADLAFGRTLSPNDAFDNYHLLVAMSYVGFIPQNGATVKVDFNLETLNDGTIKHEVSNVPVKPNYKTNIIGNLISATADYNVTLGAWATEETNVEIWDGKTISTPDFDATTQTWTIDNGAELAWFAHAVNGDLPSTVTKSSGESTVPAYSKDHKAVLGAHIQLGGHEWTTIGTKESHFMGSFDGAGYSINGLKISECCYGQPQAALFGTVSGSPTITNLTINDAEIVMPAGHTGDFYAAGLIGTFYGNLTIENVTVQNSKFVGNNKVAGLLAHDGVCSSLKIDNCHVLNCEIASANAKDGGNVGGLIGLFQGVAKGTQAAPYGDHIIKNSSVKECTINAINSTNTGKRSNGEFVACLSGKDNQTLVITHCVVEDNTFSQIYNGTDPVTYVSPYGVFVGGNRNDDGKGTVIVDGVEMIAAGLTKVEDTYFVKNSSSLQKAFDLVQDGETITVDEDLTEVACYYNGTASFTLDLNDKTLTSSNHTHMFEFNWNQVAETTPVTINITNGTLISGENTMWTIYSEDTNNVKGTFNLTNLTIDHNMPNYGAVVAGIGNTFNAENVNITTSYGIGFYAAGGQVVMNDCSAAVEGLHVKPYNSMAFAVCANGKMTINSGEYSAAPVAESDANNQGTSHGSWCGGIMNSGGTLIINGGTFSNDNFGENSLATYARGLLLADTGANLQINGGTFNALNKIIDYQNNLGTQPNPQVSITGGTFSNDPTDDTNEYVDGSTFIPAGYSVINVNGMWNVEDNGYYVDSKGNYHISTVKGWQWMAAQNDTFFGNKTVYLENDIDFAGVVDVRVTRMFTPEYSATFDGQGHTISNVFMASEYTSNNQALFDGLMSVKNLTVVDSHVYGQSRVGIIGANIFGSIDNCHVKRSRAYGYVYQVGGIVGLHSWGEIKNCSVEDTRIECYYYGAVGAIAGEMNEVSRKITGCQVKNCILIKEGPAGDYPDYDPMFGAYVGYIRQGGQYEFTGEIENTTIKGVVSQQVYGVKPESATVTFNDQQI